MLNDEIWKLNAKIDTDPDMLLEDIHLTHSRRRQIYNAIDLLTEEMNNETM